MLVPIVFFVLAFATVGALLWSGLELFREREDPLGERLEALQAHAMVGGSFGARRRAGGVLNTFLFVVSIVPGGDTWLRDIEQELAEAGIRQKTALAFYVLFHLGFLASLVAGMLYFQRASPFSLRIVSGVAAVLLGWLIPQQLLHYLVRRYRRKLQDALPDTVDLLGIVLGTGLALDQAMSRVTDEMRYIYPELASEFSTVVAQVKAGQERTKAFEQMVKRTGVEDIKSLAAMIVQSERFGTSLSQALKVYADSLRTRRRLRAETAVAKAGIKMVFPIVLFILPALFIITLVPGMLSVLQNLRQGFGPR
jgi:tight adherence protein C